MIKGFNDQYRFLSNFWPCVVYLQAAGEFYHFPSVENAYQARKHKFESWSPFQACTPGKAKQLGKRGEALEEYVKLQLMEDLNRQKFANSYLKDKLLETGDQHIEETNTWGDTFWGVCRGQGHNHLGKILMRIRHDMKA